MMGRQQIFPLILAFLAVAWLGAADEPPAGRQKSPQQETAEVRTAATSFDRMISFSGYTWRVKDGYSGPGPNHFSDSPRNVWVDSEGRLHLRIERRRGKWYAAEVVLAEALGYGTYRFVLDSAVDDLDLHAVLGLFTWCDDPSAVNCEIDIEFSRWGDELNQNASYVVQPYNQPGHMLAFEFPPEPQSTHSFTWRPTEVFFQSFRGAYDPGGGNEELQSWPFVQTVPPVENAAARMNLWLWQGRKPAGKGTKAIEVVVQRFEFEP